MPVKVIWDDEEKTIIRQIYSGRVILDDYYRAVDEFVMLANSVSHTVHSIMDRSEMLISQGSYLRAIRYGNEKMPDHIGLRVVIQASVMTKMMVNIGSRIAPRLINNVHLVDTLDEAREIIATHKASGTSTR